MSGRPGSITASQVGIVSNIIQVSGKLPTYLSPNSTLTFATHLGQNVGLGEG